MQTHRPSFILARSIASMLALSGTVLAADWTGGTSNDWNDPTNWSGGVVPVGENAIIGITGGGNPPFTATITADVPQVNDILVGRGGGPAILNHRAGIASTGNDQWLDIGTAGGTGTYNLADTTAAGGTLTGFGLGSGTVRAGGGNGGNGRIYVGGVDFSNAGGTGVFNVNTSGTVQVDNDLIIGTSGGTGTMNVDAGTITTGGWNYIGRPGDASTPGGNGTLNMSGGTLTNTGRTYVGMTNTTGKIELTGSGTYNNVNNEQFIVGEGTGSNGTIIVNGPTALLNVGGELWIGQGAGGNGSMIVSAGTVNVGNWFAVGREGSTGVVTINGTGVVQKTNLSGFLEIGNNGASNGTVNLDGGSLAVNGFRSGGTSTFNFNGGTLKTTSSDGNYMQGLTNAFVKAGGAIVDTQGFSPTIAQFLIEDPVSTGGGFTKIGAGTLTLSGFNTYTGITAVSAGTLIVTGNNASVTGATISSGGTLAFGNGGSSGMIDGDVSVASGGTLTFNRNDDFTYSAAISGAGTVNKNGPNTLTIGGSTAFFTGTTNVNAGALVLDLTQGGTVAVNNGGRLVPLANATGTLTVGALSLNTNSTTDFEFGPGPANDVIVTSNPGGLSFGSAFTLNFYDVGALTPFGTNGVYTLFDYNGSFTGSLSNLVVGNPVGGKGYALTNDVGTTSIRLTVSDVTLSAWNIDGGGLWTVGTNWTAGVPNAVSAEAVFGAAITAPVTVDMNGNKTLGKVMFDNSSSYTIGGSGTLTLDNGATASTITVSDQFNGAGSHVIDVPITATGNLSITTATGASVRLAGLGGGNLTTNGAGTVILNGAGTYGTTTVNGGTLNVGTGGTTGSLGTGAVSLAGGTSLNFIRADAITLSNAISGDGGVNHNGGGSLTYTGTATYTGATGLNGGPFINEGTINGTSNLNIENATTLRLASSTTVADRVNIAAVNNSSLTVTDTATLTANRLFVGNGADGSVTISGGMITTNQLVFGETSTGTGTMTAGRVDVGAWNVIGRVGGTGTFNQSGGELNQNHFDFLTVGENSTGIYNMTGTAVLNNQAVVDTSDRDTEKGDVIVGRNSGGVGIWNLSDTASARVRDLLVGTGAGSDGEVNVGGSSSLVSQDRDLLIGQGGTGRVNINGGTATFNQGWVYIGQNTGSNGTLTVNSGSLSSDRFFVGQSGNGTINVVGGALTAADTVLLGENAGGRGIVSVSAGTFNKTGGDFIVSDGGLGVVNISGTGSMTSSGNFIVGNGASGTGHVSVTGGSLTVGSELWVGQRRDEVQVEPSVLVPGKGLMDVSAGSVSANSWIAVGRENGLGVLNVRGTGEVTKTGGAGSFIVIGSNGGNNTLGGTGIANVLGGTLQTLGGGDIRLAEGLATGVLNLRGGVARADAFRDAGGVSQIYFSGGTAKAAISEATFMQGFDNVIVGPGGATIDTDGNNITIAQSLDAPTGDGVTTIDILPGNGGSGYVAQPIVEITGDGFGASAIANVGVDGEVTSITITNPGIGYTTASVILHGGGETTAATLEAPTLGLNVATGGLTKIGDGTLTITADGTYGGATTVNDGTLEFAVSQTLSSLVIADGATVVLTETPPAPGFAEAPGLEMEAASLGMESQAAAVPEPGALGLLAAGALGILGRRRRTQAKV